jgi:uncharacterized membrane protein
MHATLAYTALGALSLGLAFHLLSRLIGRPAIRAAGRWLVLIGALAIVPAATTGICPYYDVVRSAGDHDDEAPAGAHPWYRLARDAAPRIADDRLEGLAQHGQRMAWGAAVVLIAVLSLLGASDSHRRRRWRIAAVFILVLATSFMAWEGWNARSRAAAAAASGEYAGDVIDPLQTHVALGGVTAAVALAALTASVRRARRQVLQDTADANQSSRYAPRLWAAATLVASATAAAGAWVAGLFGNCERTKATLAQPRDLAHATLGVTIVALAVVLAMLTRRPQRRRWMTRATGALLLAALVLQIAMGTLLLYDGSNRGASVWRFRSPTVQRPTSLDAD